MNGFHLRIVGRMGGDQLGIRVDDRASMHYDEGTGALSLYLVGAVRAQQSDR